MYRLVGHHGRLTMIVSCGPLWQADDSCTGSDAATHVPSCNTVRALQLLGEAIKTLPREDVKIATKIGKYAPGKSFTITATAGRLL